MGRRADTGDTARGAATGAAAGRPKNALAALDEIGRRCGSRRVVLFLDYDGTLTPIVQRPGAAVLSTGMRDLLERLARRTAVAIVSGRDLEDVRERVGVEGAYYAGSHGFDIAGPKGLRMEYDEARALRPALDATERRLRDRLGAIDGVHVERKRFALAVHDREVGDAELPRVAELVDETLHAEPWLRYRRGKRVYDIQPDVEWDKGRAVLWLLRRLGLDGNDVIPFYIGDDTTDEDAFRALAGLGICIRVGPPEEPTAAEYVLADTAELLRFLRALADRLDDG